MKAQSEATIQFSGYPLSVVQTKSKKKAELIVVKPSETFPVSLPNNLIANNPEHWDVDWFRNYE